MAGSHRGQYQPVGSRARMTRPEGSGEGQQPAAAVEALDHTGDLAMANPESAAVVWMKRTRTLFNVLSPLRPDPLPVDGGLPAVSGADPGGAGKSVNRGGGGGVGG